MTTQITAVQTENISHAVFVDLEINGTTYYISTAYAPITISGNTYTELGALLQIGELSDDLKTTNGDVTLSLSGVPSEADYMGLVLNTPIKGGRVTIRRGFFDAETL